MKVRWCPGETAIEGTVLELRRVSEALRAVSGSLGEAKRLAADLDGAAVPYERLLAGLLIESRPTRLQVGVDQENWLRFAGDAQALGAAATYFAFPDDAPTGAHAHLEWYPGHPTIERGALPVVIGVGAAG
jgi:hypothetical protein